MDMLDRLLGPDDGHPFRTLDPTKIIEAHDCTWEERRSQGVVIVSCPVCGIQAPERLYRGEP